MNSLLTSLLRLLICMCALSCCLVELAPAQDTWTIEGEQPYFSGLTSTEARHVSMTPHGGDGEQTLIIRHRIKEDFQWTCYKLPQLKLLSSFPEPANWNWENHSFGSKYASSLNAGQLTTIDLTTGQPLKTVSVPMPGYIQILFDKALVVESGYVFALPSLQPVANHPLVNNAYCPFASDLNFNLPRDMRPTWRLDANRWVVDGFVYGPDLKPEPLFLGKYSYRRDSGRYRGFRSDTNRQGESARMKILLNDATLAEAVCPKTDYYGITLGFEPFGNGWLAVDRETLLFFECKPKTVLPKTWADRKTFPIMVPPLLTFGGDYQAVQWIGGNMTECELGNLYVAGLESRVEGDQFMVRISSREFMRQFPHGSALLQKIEMESGVGPQATWDQVIAGYKARNMHWIAPYAAAMKVRFSGIPVELPCPLTYYHQTDRAVTVWTSIILDVPTEEIEPYRTRDLPPAKPPASVPSDRDQLQRLATALSSQKETIEAPPAPAPVTLPPLPAIFDPSTVQGTFSWVVPAHATRLKLMPLRLMLSALTILLAAWFIHGFFPSVQFVGNKWLTLILMVVACDFFDTGFVFLVDLFTEDPQKDFGIFDVLKMVLMYAVYLPFALFVHFKSLQANWTRIVAVYITATLIYMVIWFTILSLILSVTFALMNREVLR